MAQVRVQNISKSFGSTQVLRDVNLDIRDGEFMTLVGPSGCGKSTLLRIIAGLEFQDRGHIEIGETAVDSVRPRDRNLAMVFQSYALYPHLTVRENIAVPLVMRRLGFAQRLPLAGGLVPGTARSRREIDSDVARVAETLNIAHLLDRKPGQLSGGQRQRVALGRAMVRNPSAFLMDEPLSNLDAKLRVHMRAEIAQLHGRLGTTFIYVTHDQAEAMTMSDRIAMMMDGDILQTASPEEMYNDPADIRVAEFIGSPKINIVDTVADDHGRPRVNGNRLHMAVRCAAGETVRVGFRPEAASVCDGEDADLRGAVVHTENLGSDLLVHMRVAGADAPVVVRCPPGRGAPRSGEQAGIVLPAGSTLAFGSGGERLSLDTVEAGHG
jgi:multiple sugar transport system ATP-binding protein